MARGWWWWVGAGACFTPRICFRAAIGSRGGTGLKGKPESGSKKQKKSCGASQSRFPKSDQSRPCWGGVCPSSAPPSAPAHTLQTLHHFDTPLLCFPSAVHPVLQPPEGHAARRGSGRSGPLGLPPDGRKGLQPAADHLQGESATGRLPVRRGGNPERVRR